MFHSSFGFAALQTSLYMHIRAYIQGLMHRHQHVHALSNIRGGPDVPVYAYKCIYPGVAMHRHQHVDTYTRYLTFALFILALAPRP